MTIPEIREAAARLLETGWTQGDYAADARGLGVDDHDPRAVRWCLVGALNVACPKGRDYANLRGGAYAELQRELGVGLLSDWNDEPGRTQSEVVAAMRGRQPIPETSERGEP
jgi:hypothetical protein